MGSLERDYFLCRYLHLTHSVRLQVEKKQEQEDTSPKMVEVEGQPIQPGIRSLKTDIPKMKFLVISAGTRCYHQSPSQSTPFHYYIGNHWSGLVCLLPGCFGGRGEEVVDVPRTTS
jgi:hypothetical protein